MSGDPSLAPSVISGMGRRRKRSHRRRSKKMSGMTGSYTGDIILGLAAGVVGNLLIDKFTPSAVSDKIKSGGKAGIGGLLIFKGKNNPLLLGFGFSLASSGVTELAHDFGVLSAIEDAVHGLGIGKRNDSMLIEMNGTDVNSTSFMQGDPALAPSVIQGDEMGDDMGDDMSGEFMGGTEMPMPSVVG